MKVKAHGPFSVKWPNGDMWSPVPGQEVEISDKDTEKINFLYDLADSGHVTILDEVKAAPKKVEVKTSEGTGPSKPGNKVTGR